MATQDIKPKFAASAALTLSLASLASSTSGVGRQATLVNNSVTRYNLIHLFGKTTTGTSPTAGRAIYIYAIRGDGTRRTDGAGANDAALTRVTARLLRVIPTDATSNKGYEWDCDLHNPGPEWGILIVHDTVAALNATAGNHYVYWVGEHTESADAA